MPHAWRLPARSRVSPRACATDASPAIPAAIAGALVRRTPIGWTALLDRVLDPRDRASLEALRRLDTLRGRQGPAALLPGRGLRIVLLRLLVALAVLQTIWALARAAATVWSGGSIGPVGPPLLGAAAFVSARLMLGSAAPRGRRGLLLGGTFTFAAGGVCPGAPARPGRRGRPPRAPFSGAV